MLQKLLDFELLAKKNVIVNHHIRSVTVFCDRYSAIFLAVIRSYRAYLYVSTVFSKIFGKSEEGKSKQTPAQLVWI